MIDFHNAAVSYHDRTVLENISLHLAPGEHAALLGPSGCGKTTLLNLVAGLIAPSSGSVTVSSRRIAYVFQEPRLFPWRTARQNVNAVLTARKQSLSEADEWLRRVCLADSGGKYPRELSGGMQQRVALARALAYDGDILLLDEPFKGLDAALCRTMISLLCTHLQGKTLLLVTHSPKEAQALADTVYTYRDGAFLRA